jgi:phosphomannomutase
VKRLIAFDLDGTLTESKQPLDTAMASALAGLLDVTEVAIISGGDWPQFQKQVIGRLVDGTNLARLWIMPTTGAKLYRFQQAAWHEIYADIFDASARAAIFGAIRRAVDDARFNIDKIWGQQIEDRGTQVTFSALGQEAPIDAKKEWDPDFTKRKALQAALREALPDVSVNIGGSTSIDVTRKGVDKGYGLRRLAEHSGLPLTAMLFVGDAIYPGGNDYPAHEAGVDTISVRDVAETWTVISAITSWVGRAG